MTKKMILPLVLLLFTAAWGADERAITVKLTVPDAAWTIAIDEVHEVGKELWVISTVSRDPDVMGAQVISTVQASVKLAAPDWPTKHFVIGKTWGWKNEEPYIFIKDLKQIEKELKSGKFLYKRAADGQTAPAGLGTDPRDVLGETWEWVSTITPAEKITVPTPDRYTIRLTDDGKLQARFDCNCGGGTYEISPSRLSFGPLLSTRRACPEGSLGGPFMRDLQRVLSFFIQDGNLYLELPFDSGTMRFRPAP
jgi:heat shock protein HslJ